MTPVSTESVAPDEDTFAFPDSWRKHLHPRRGGTAGPVVKIDKKAVAATDELVAAVRAQWLDAGIANLANDPELAAQVRQTLEGEANPLGAAALALAAVPLYSGKLAPFVDAWTVRHGIALAAVAAVKVGAVSVSATGPQHLGTTGIGHSTPARTALQIGRAHV